VARYPGFVGPAYRSQSKIASDDALVNWYPEKIENPFGKVEWALYPTPGLEEVATTGVADERCRAMFTINGRAFYVAGQRLIEVFADDTILVRGTGLGDLDGSPATIMSNGDAGQQLGITSGSKFYVYDLEANTLTFVADAATQCGFIDGFGVLLDPQTSTIKLTELEDFSTLDPLAVAQRNAGADRWSGMIVSHKEIWLFGSQTTEVWYNAGAAIFPFLPNPSVFINIGILAPFSVAILDNAPIWLGSSTDGTGIVYRANGYAPQRVSTHALEYELSTYETLLDAQAWTYQEQGHNFYVLTFPTAGRTWVFDASTGAWHQRGEWNGDDYGSVPNFGHMFAFGTHYTGDRESGKLYRQSVDLTTDSTGRVQRRMRRAPHLSKENTRIGFDKFQLDLEVGLGLSTGQGSDPTLMLRWSSDGGQTWGNEHWTSAGVQGAYSARAIWRMLGAGRDRVYELVVTDPIPWRILDAWIDTRPGTS